MHRCPHVSGTLTPDIWIPRISSARPSSPPPFDCFSLIMRMGARFHPRWGLNPHSVSRFRYLLKDGAGPAPIGACLVGPWRSYIVSHWKGHAFWLCPANSHLWLSRACWSRPTWVSQSTTVSPIWHCHQHTICTDGPVPQLLSGGHPSSTYWWGKDWGQNRGVPLLWHQNNL